MLAVGCSRGGIFANGKIPVTVEKVLVEEKPATLSLPATLEPATKLAVQFPLDVRVEKVPVRLGDKVSAGQILVELSQRDFTLQIAKLKVDLMKREALVEKNSYFFENRARLLTEGKIDQTQHDSLESELKSSRADAEQLKAQTALLENQSTQPAVKAPFDGVISSLNITPEANIPAGQTLLTLTQIDPILVRFQLPASEASGVAIGMNVTVTVEGGGDTVLPAAITFIQPELEEASHHFMVKATLANPNNILKGGMEAEVRLTSQRPVKKLRVPAQAVVNEGGKEILYVVQNNRAWPVRVYPKPSDDNPALVEVEGNLKEDAVVVIEGQDKLKAGAEVNLWR